METILITGANRGIGFELVKCFLNVGNHVIATCRDLDKATELNALSDNSRLEIQLLEVTSQASISALVSKLGNRSIDVLINNAGKMGELNQSLESIDYDDWLVAFQVNTLAPFRITVSMRNNLNKSAYPRVITLSSQMGSLNRKSKGFFAYRSSKAAVNKAMQVLALELKEDGIIVCPVHPGWVRTDMGGTNADISAEESAAGLLKLISSLKMEHTGRFWTWEGKEHPW